ncbi:unnamed protein product, partial [Symbiodinium pilosum]
LAQSIAVRQMRLADGTISTEEAGCWKCCRRAKCDGGKYLTFGGKNAIFDKCRIHPGKWKEDGHVVKPEHTSARFSLDPGEHMCRETCQVLTVAED